MKNVICTSIYLAQLLLTRLRCHSAVKYNIVINCEATPSHYDDVACGGVGALFPFRW